MKATSSLLSRAERALYSRVNSGRFYSVRRLQAIAQIAYNAGSRAIMVLCYANGNSNGRDEGNVLVNQYYS